ncbi:MAG: hypothetical protein JO141_08425 [Bradyrhizobium sp.]|nr:hypothetical protein [Bradyrhizobium sp.]
MLSGLLSERLLPKALLSEALLSEALRLREGIGRLLLLRGRLLLLSKGRLLLRKALRLRERIGELLLLLSGGCLPRGAGSQRQLALLLDAARFGKPLLGGAFLRLTLPGEALV